MVEVLSIVAQSWPIAFMVVGTGAAIVVNRRLKQAMDDSRAVRDMRASQAVTVRDRDG